MVLHQFVESRMGFLFKTFFPVRTTDGPSTNSSQIFSYKYLLLPLESVAVFDLWRTTFEWSQNVHQKHYKSVPSLKYKTTIICEATNLGTNFFLLYQCKNLWNTQFFQFTKSDPVLTNLCPIGGGWHSLGFDIASMDVIPSSNKPWQCEWIFSKGYFLSSLSKKASKGENWVVMSFTGLSIYSYGIFFPITQQRIKNQGFTAQAQNI